MSGEDESLSAVQSRMTTSSEESEHSETEDERLGDEEEKDDVTFSGRARTVSFEERSMRCREESMRAVDGRTEEGSESKEEKSLSSLDESSSLAHSSFFEVGRVVEH